MVVVQVITYIVHRERVVVVGEMGWIIIGWIVSNMNGKNLELFGMSEDEVERALEELKESDGSD